MGKEITAINPETKQWIEQQKIFFVATAPLSAEGHVNLSPKGLESFRVLSPLLVVYHDLTGSGVETIAHLNENKRIVIMFCAFNGPPKILRLYGRGEVVLPHDERFVKFQDMFPARTGTRSFILVHITRLQDSCGYGVPLFDFKKERDVLTKWSDKKGITGVKEYQQRKNKVSIDGLKGL